MTPALLLVALAAGAIGLVIGLPAWRSWQARAAADRNAERYLAWRGRGDRPASGPGQQMTVTEQRRLLVGAGLGLVAVACVVIGLWTG